MTPPDEFQLRHSGEIREALITLEGDSGAFELLAHGIFPPSVRAPGALFAVVRSSGSDRVYLLVHPDDPARPRSREWHAAEAADLPRFH
jgi:hypothetical protein